MSNIIAIYHKDCIDGTTAAAVLLTKYPSAQVFPLGHGFEAHELEPILSLAQPNDTIFTVDCVIGVRELLSKGCAVTSIDHHAGIKDEMMQLAKDNPKFTFVFDTTKSGASLSWNYFFPTLPTPEIIRYVEDADLWNWKYGTDTKDVNNFLFLMTNRPTDVQKLFNTPLDEVKKDGKAISGYTDYIVQSAVEKTEPIYLSILGHKVPFYNITILKSESGNKLTLLRKEAVGLFSIDGNKVKISFRGLDQQKPNALELAQALGGSGHTNAAGAGMKLEDFIQAIVK